MSHIKPNLEEQLLTHFGFSSFREGQKEIIESVLGGHHTLATLPTGSGKSICYQLPSVINEGLTIVVSPLISLMVDQVKLLKSEGFKRVTALNSLLNFKQKSQIIKNLDQYNLVYCSPEMLQQPAVINRLKHIKVDLFVIDEAHCISQWGHEFRPDYLRLRELIQALEEPTILALSATATPEVQEDIIKSLSVDMKRIIYPMDRINITYNVLHSENQLEKQEQLHTIIKQVDSSTMIYFSSRQMTEQISLQLKQQFPDRQIAYYHGGMDQQDRLLIQQQFMHDQLDIICCTSAFGMGVNKNNIRLVIHYHLPPNLESFIQETGRAGRDGAHCVSALLYSKGDEAIPFQIIESELPEDHEIKQYLSQDRQDTMDFLTETKQRFLEYHSHQLKVNNDISELSIINKLIAFRDKRKKVKIKSVLDMVQWINTEECKRKRLFESYQSNTREAEFECCNSCGFNIYDWELERTHELQSKDNWREILDEMFYRGV
ncbi:ATP-dependent DNA helicase RecQ [Filobacillus milosensis]|uniref:ATP-dependent DNA helicase RecQ n=1 Tax=Filobacillus milosensis TaxID=94137 RepID=A0A4Y8IQK6_9BACI|nr:ATP-dependent DNA helicase RecQ [Filobacillus milosensis]TFB23944.1 ATP-dependent DNA helicase RecQ [Filobacillus milosensis]